jgi:hypothetical protein
MKRDKPISAPAPDAQRAALAEATQALDDLQAKRAALIMRAGEYDEERKKIAYAAFSSRDAEAAKRLNNLREQAVRFDFELRDLDNALEVAHIRVADAQADLDRVLADQRQQDIAGELQSVVEYAGRADQALAAFVAAIRDMTDRLYETRRLGADNPSHAQLETLGWLALCTAFENTLFRRRVDRVPPLSRTTFTAFASKWAGHTDNEKDQAA